MKIAGFFLLIAGWLLVVTALVLLTAPGARNAFVAAGIAAELLGLALAFRSHLAPVRS